MNQEHLDPLDLLDPKVNRGCQDMMECKVDQVIQEIKVNLAYLGIQDCLANLVYLDPKVKEELEHPWVWVWAWVWVLEVIFQPPLLRVHRAHLGKKVRLVEMVGMVNQANLVHLAKEANVGNLAGMVTVWVGLKAILVHQDLKAKWVILGTQEWMVCQAAKVIKATKV